MNLTALLSLALAWLPQSQETREQIQALPGGHELVREQRLSLGPHSGSGASQGIVDTVRWMVDDAGAGWIADSVSVGDDGALIAAGEFLNAPGYVIHHAGSELPIVSRRTDALRTRVAVADRSPVVAVLSVHPKTLSSGLPGVQAELEVLDGGVSPAWSYLFPESAYYSFPGQGVRVSDDGEVILAWFKHYDQGGLLIEAFRRDGTPISSMKIGQSPGYVPAPFRVSLSDDGSRALFMAGSRIHLREVATGRILFVQEIRNLGWFSMFAGATMSGDGKRLAFGYYGRFRIYGESPGGGWNLIREHAVIPEEPYLPDTDWPGPMDLDGDGSRLAYTVQHSDAKAFEVRMMEVDTGAVLFSRTLAEPATTVQLWAVDLKTDDAGRMVAGCSWGDSLQTTPEGFVFDDKGNLLSEHHVYGSAMAVDLDPSGQVLVMGTKNAHANHFGHGGQVICADPRPADLRLLGYPAPGGQLELVIRPNGTRAVVAASTALGTSPTPFGVSQLDLGTLVARSSILSIPPQGLSKPLDIPAGGSLPWRKVHLQAALLGEGLGHLSNRVSLRILP